VKSCCPVTLCHIVMSCHCVMARLLLYRPPPHDTTTEATLPFLVHERTITKSSFIDPKKTNRYFIIARGGHGLPKVLARPAMPLLCPAGRLPLKRPEDLFRSGLPTGLLLTPHAIRLWVKAATKSID
jgi:hypothetical protein